MEQNSNQKTAVVALSGGVDSSVCCYLLKEQGYKVTGITGKMTNLPCAEITCQNAKKVADNLGIDHIVLDLTEDFYKNVIEYFNETYKNGKTPNPCAMCNRTIKWGKIFDYAMNELHADVFATGHYANIQNIGEYKTLFPAKDEKKDQMYFLYALNQTQLNKTIFPLYEYEKTQVREIAEKIDVPSKYQKDSLDTCFIEKPQTLKGYLHSLLGDKKGEFVHISTGKKLGEHTGFYHYTIGQRKGLEIAYSEPLYVIKIDAENNIVYVGEKKYAYGTELKLKNINFVYPFEQKSFDVKTKIRYNMEKVDAHVEISENEVLMTFNEPVYSITPAQIAVFYDKNDGHLIGGGEII